MIDPCRELRKSSRYVYRWLRQQPGVKEESLTDWLLYDLSKRLPYVHYIAFTRHQEARQTGADWEWWILFSARYFRFRVQAKKVYSKKDNYSELARTNRYGLQIDKLLLDSARANAIPLYALYSDESAPTLCRHPANPRQEGAFLADANRIYKDFIAGPRGAVSSVDLLSRSNPFSCFACCPLAAGPNMDFSIYLSQYYRGGTGPEGVTAEMPRGLHTELPGYVSSLLDRPSALDVLDWSETEFDSQLQDFNGVLVYDYRNRV